jgi:glycosyltransferase involved in cell wall biosynthesis
VVHSTNWGTLVETSLARRWAGVPWHVHAERGLQFEWRRRSAMRRAVRDWVMKRMLSRADQVVVPAYAIRDDLVRRFGRGFGRLAVIPNGVERLPCGAAVDDRRIVRAELGISQAALVLGSVGRLVSVKGFELAVDVTARLVQTGCDVHLVLVGDGPERDSLREQARTAGIGGRVHFAGRRADVGCWLNAFDIFVNTSRSEGMSQSIVEAIAAGLPLVVTDVGDHRVLVDGSDACGHVVPADDAAALTSTLRALVASPEACDRLRENARKRYQRQYTVERMVTAYETLYLQVAARRA